MKKKTCFWRHDWGNWKQYSLTMHSMDRRTGKGSEATWQEWQQKRYCKRCNKMQIEIIE